MAVGDLAVTLTALLEWQAPDGTVRLNDGGLVRFDPGGGEVEFVSHHPVFGTLVSFAEIESGLGDQVEGGTFAFAPAADAAVGDWWREDLENTRMKLWLAEVLPDRVTATGAALLADWVVDTAERNQAEGSDLLSLKFMTRHERLFLINQGNVASDRFHQSIWPGERGFANCTDSQQFFAWGIAAPIGGSGGGGGGGFGGGGGMDITPKNFNAQ